MRTVETDDFGSSLPLSFAIRVMSVLKPMALRTNQHRSSPNVIPRVAMPQWSVRGCGKRAFPSALGVVSSPAPNLSHWVGRSSFVDDDAAGVPVRVAGDESSTTRCLSVLRGLRPGYLAKRRGEGNGNGEGSRVLTVLPREMFGRCPPRERRPCTASR